MLVHITFRSFIRILPACTREPTEGSLSALICRMTPAQLNQFEELRVATNRCERRTQRSSIFSTQKTKKNLQKTPKSCQIPVASCSNFVFLKRKWWWRCRGTMCKRLTRTEQARPALNRLWLLFPRNAGGGNGMRPSQTLMRASLV